MIIALRIDTFLMQIDRTNSFAIAHIEHQYFYNMKQKKVELKS